MRRLAFTSALAMLICPVAIAQDRSADEPLVRRDRVRLTTAGAKVIQEAAESKAAEMGLKSTIAIVDDGGHLVALVRMEGGRPASVATSQTKAIAAATFRMPTGPLAAPPGVSSDLFNISLQMAAIAGGGRITSLNGGVPIVVDGQIIGAVGVGGGTGEQDAEVANAGIAALLERLK